MSFPGVPTSQVRFEAEKAAKKRGLELDEKANKDLDCNTSERLSFMGRHVATKQWTRIYTFGGSLVENADQAASRDLLAEAMYRVDALPDFDLLLSIHDEVIAEAPVGSMMPYVTDMLLEECKGDKKKAELKAFEGRNVRGAALGYGNANQRRGLDWTTFEEVMPTKDRYWQDPERWRTETTRWRGAQPSEYAVWANMIQRCHNENSKDFYRYGGRGIVVCLRWRESFAAFLTDMGPRPTARHTIERRNNNFNYCKSNCEWALPKQQSRNTRTNHVVVLCGRSQCVSAWAEELGINRSTIYTRLKRGWSPERALS